MFSLLKKIRPTSKIRFLIFISGSVLVAFSLVCVSMALYTYSGTAQLDLSRPGYVSVRSQANSTESNYKSFSSTGTIDIETITEFQTIFNDQADKIVNANAFSTDPLGQEALGLGF